MKVYQLIDKFPLDYKFSVYPTEYICVDWYETTQARRYGLRNLTVKNWHVISGNRVIIIVKENKK